MPPGPPGRPSRLPTVLHHNAQGDCLSLRVEHPSAPLGAHRGESAFRISTQPVISPCVSAEWVLVRGDNRKHPHPPENRAQPLGSAPLSRKARADPQ